MLFKTTFPKHSDLNRIFLQSDGKVCFFFLVWAFCPPPQRRKCRGVEMVCFCFCFLFLFFSCVGTKAPPAAKCRGVEMVCFWMTNKIYVSFRKQFSKICIHHPTFCLWFGIISSSLSSSWSNHHIMQVTFQSRYQANNQFCIDSRSLMIPCQLK